jgi:hypothetical protein
VGHRHHGTIQARSKHLRQDSPWSEKLDEYGLSIGDRIVIIRCQGRNTRSAGGSSGKSEEGKEKLHDVVVSYLGSGWSNEIVKSAQLTAGMQTRGWISMEFRREQCWNVIFTGHCGILDPSSDLTRKPVLFYEIPNRTQIGLTWNRKTVSYNIVCLSDSCYVHLSVQKIRKNEE